MTRGIRMIDGQQYLLGGRTRTKERAVSERTGLLKEWTKVRIVKLWAHDFMLYAHGRRETVAAQETPACSE